MTNQTVEVDEMAKSRLDILREEFAIVPSDDLYAEVYQSASGVQMYIVASPWSEARVPIMDYHDFRRAAQKAARELALQMEGEEATALQKRLSGSLGSGQVALNIRKNLMAGEVERVALAIANAMKRQYKHVDVRHVRGQVVEVIDDDVNTTYDCEKLALAALKATAEEDT
ncbi:hypothetical protein GN330_22690 [Nitratireductor sp. CAU 1489]|uniref:Uncharacterized protein n=1 Tax=Nitratireductor arenosus TaxID=2682096 RepID=A0A844QKA7_9HYPH|nr:hypothetical protein [Nitratireductor arenosus]MVB00063.1 hypothetical protein [Nitratireductor arenosus]